MVLIPFPFSAERHQELNARTVAEAGAALVLADSELSPERFVELVSDGGIDLPLMGRNALRLARPKAAEEIADAIL